MQFCRWTNDQNKWLFNLLCIYHYQRQRDPRQKKVQLIPKNKINKYQIVWSSISREFMPQQSNFVRWAKHREVAGTLPTHPTNVSLPPLIFQDLLFLPQKQTDSHFFKKSCLLVSPQFLILNDQISQLWQQLTDIISFLNRTSNSDKHLKVKIFVIIRHEKSYTKRKNRHHVEINIQTKMSLKKLKNKYTTKNYSN